MSNTSWSVYDSYAERPEDKDKGRDRDILVLSNAADEASVCHIASLPHGTPVEVAQRELARARLIAAAPKLLAYAECEAAIACGKADPRYDANPVLIGHGWNRETESVGLFLTRIRRYAIEASTGSYLGRAA